MKPSFVKYETFNIEPGLANFVKYLWRIEAEPNDGDYFIFRTYATIYPTLFLARQGFVTPADKPGNGNLLLVGQSNKWCRYKLSNDFEVVGITFYPFALPLLFELQADLVTNRHLDATELDQYQQLSAFCREIAGSKFNLETVNNLLLNRVGNTRSYDERILSLISAIASEQADARELSGERVFMSQRNFERKFKYYSGFTPKSFANLIRLSNSFSAVSFGNKKLSDVAYEQNYFDQSHFSNEFKVHTGFQPKVFASGAGTAENVVWNSFVDFFQFLSICPPVLCKNKPNIIV